MSNFWTFGGLRSSPSLEKSSPSASAPAVAVAAAAAAESAQDEEEVQSQEKPHGDGGDVTASDTLPLGTPVVHAPSPAAGEDHDSDKDYDSASERMGAASSVSSFGGGKNGGFRTPTSPVGSLVGESYGSPAPGMDVGAEGALLRLNEMSTGNPSLDTAVLEDVDEEGFRKRVSEIVDKAKLPADSPKVETLVDSLLPIVRSLSMRQELFADEQVNGDGGAAASGGDGPSPAMPSAKVTDDDDADFDLPVGGQDEEEDREGGDEEEGEEEEEEEEEQEGEGEGEEEDEEEEVEEGGGDEGEQQRDGDENVSVQGMSVRSDEPSEAKPLVAPQQAEGEAEHKEGEVGKGEVGKGEEEEGEEEGAGEEGAAQQLEEAEPLHAAGMRVQRDADNGGAAAKQQGEEGQLEEGRDEEEGEDEGGEEEGEEDEGDEERDEVGEEGGEEIRDGAHEGEGEGEDEGEEGEGEGEGEGDEWEDEDDEDFEEALARNPMLQAAFRQASAARDAADGDAGRSAGGGGGPVGLGVSGGGLPPPPSSGSGGAGGRTLTNGSSGRPSLEPVASGRQRGSGGGDMTVRESDRPVAVTASDGDGGEVVANGEEPDETREKLQKIRIKLLRLAHRLGQSAHNVVVAQVLYRLGLAEQLRANRGAARGSAFSFDAASAAAEEQEAAGGGTDEDLDFVCTIMLLGKTGVGKSATVNSIFDHPMTKTDAFATATGRVREIVGTVHGICVRVIDTPGLQPSASDQRKNEQIMASVKKFVKKRTPDIVLYFDRLDLQSRDYGDLPLMRIITDTFGTAVWFNAIVVLTHASSAPPDGSNGQPMSYEMYVAQRSHVVQQTIRQAAGDMRLMNPVSLVENHPNCRMNRAGQRVLPNGQIWKPQLLLLCFASKILAEANALLKLQDSTPARPFGTRPRVPSLPYLLSTLLQSRQPLKLPEEQLGEEDEEEDDDDLDDDDDDDEVDYDSLPPFRRMTKDELAELTEGQRREYYEELAERERLYQKKQWKEELLRRREMKKRAGQPDAEPIVEELEPEDDGPRSSSVPVPMPDMALPPSFDSDNPTHRYRYLETANQWLVRPLLEAHGWDHDAGYDGFSLEKQMVVQERIPAAISGQITKDKKEANINLEAAATFKHGKDSSRVTTSGLDIQTVGKDLAYTMRSETRFSNFKKNKTTAGLALTYLGGTVAAGLKVEDKLLVGKQLKLVVSGGAITGKGDMAYGASAEATIRRKGYPIDKTVTVLGLSIMDWQGDLAIGGNLQSQFQVGKTMMVARANLNNRGAGQINLRASSNEQLQMAIIGLVPMIRFLLQGRPFSSPEAESEPLQ
eukprot:SM000009S23585  [mRNA]  locus=s9:902015:907983:+ [translate_table: standard]